MPKDEKRVNCINKLILRGRYDAAISEGKKTLRELPHNDFVKHWVYSQISSAYYEKRKYKLALKWAEKSYKIAPNCPVVLWHYAGACVYNRKSRKSINLYRKIIDIPLKKLEEGICGEGGNIIKSDCRVRIALCYAWLGDYKSAVKWCKLFLRYYCSGGIEKKEFGEKLLKKYQKEIHE